MSGPFVDTLLLLLGESTGDDQRGSPNADRIDHIVVETTGVADPESICRTLRKGALSSLVRIDQIVTVVDSTRILQQMEENEIERENIALAQIYLADTILLSKIDLIESREVLDRIVSTLRGMQRRARIITCSRGLVPLDYLLDAGCCFEYLKEKEKESEEGEGEDHSCTEDGHGHGHHGHGHGHHGHGHGGHDHGKEKKKKKTTTESEGFMSLSFRFDCQLSKAVFTERVLPLFTINTLRAKGILWFHEIPDRRLIFHFAAQRYSFEESKWEVPTTLNESSSDGKTELMKTEFVVIGRNLDKNALEEAFQACVTKNVRELHVPSRTLHV